AAHEHRSRAFPSLRTARRRGARLRPRRAGSSPSTARQPARPMTFPESVSFEPLLVASGMSLAAGLLIGLGIGYVRRVRLEAALEVRDAELDARESAETEREAALALASEKLRSSFGQLANEQFRQHAETFLQLARENLGA